VSTRVSVYAGEGPGRAWPSAGAAVAFREVGPVELKGVSGAMRLYAAHRPG